MYSNVVLDIDHNLFEERLEEFKEEHGYTLDTDLDADDWAQLIADYKAIVETRARRALPAGPERAAVGRDRRGVRARG